MGDVLPIILILGIAGAGAWCFLAGPCKDMLDPAAGAKQQAANRYERIGIESTQHTPEKVPQVAQNAVKGAQAVLSKGTDLCKDPNSEICKQLQGTATGAIPVHSHFARANLTSITTNGYRGSFF